MEQVIRKPGELVGHYQILEHLGTGGFCALYEAQDLTDRDGAGSSAVKVCRWHPATMTKEERQEHNWRHRREFDLLHRLNHRNVVRALECRQHDGLAYYAMELLKGPTLGAFLAKDRRPLWVLADIFQQIVEGVAYCHREGIVHRDLKPSNLIITDNRAPGSAEREEVLEREREQEGWLLTSMPEAPLVSEWGPELARSCFQPVLIDLGISQSAGEWPVNGPERRLGTLEYLSPESCRTFRARRTGLADATEAREDVYALGVLLFSLLTGRLPWRASGDDFEALLAEIAEASPRDPREFNPHAPPGLAALARRCLETEAKRPIDGGELLWRVNEAIEEDRARHLELFRPFAPEYRVSGETPVELQAAALAHPSAATAGEAESVGMVALALRAPGEGRPDEAGASATPPPPDPPAAVPPGSGDGRRPDPATDEDRRIAQNIRIAGELFERSQRDAARARWTLRGAGVMLLGTFGLLAALCLYAEKLGDRAWAVAKAEASLASRAERFAHLENPPFRFSLLNVEPPLTPLLLSGGLKMPEAPLPGQLRPPCIWEGHKLHAKILWGGCWLETANVGWVMDLPQKDRKCPDDMYDPPPDATDDDTRSGCYRAIVPRQKPRPAPSALGTAEPAEAR